MQAILFEQIAFRVARCGLRNEEIGRATGQDGFPTGDAVVQEIACIGNDGCTAVRIIATCAGGQSLGMIPAAARAARSSDVMLMGVMLDTGKEVRS
jgi:hypothetical protein